jgi:hypothetical protein
MSLRNKSARKTYRRKSHNPNVGAESMKNSRKLTFGDLSSLVNIKTEERDKNP